MMRFLSLTNKFLFIVSLVVFSCDGRQATSRIDLSGEWVLAIDSLDAGNNERWFEKELSEKITLPGSLTSNGIENAITRPQDGDKAAIPVGAFKILNDQSKGDVLLIINNQWNYTKMGLGNYMKPPIYIKPGYKNQVRMRMMSGKPND